MPGPIFLENESVTLRPAETTDTSFLRTNEQDPRVRASRGVTAPVDEEWAKRRLGGTMGRNGDTLGLLVCADESPVGFAYLIRERPNAQAFRFAELAYWVTPSEWDNGYATAAGRLLLDHAFSDLGLHRVTASAYVSNHASRHVLEKLGFTREGMRRKAAFVDGEWIDTAQYGLLAEEWCERKESASDQT